MALTELQKFVLPGPSNFGPIDNYIRTTGGYYSPETKCFQFFKGVELNTLTFYNAFSVVKWKRSTNIDKLTLRLVGCGRVRIQISVAQLDHYSTNNRAVLGRSSRQLIVHRILSENEVELGDKSQTRLEVPNYNDLKEGLVYCRILPLEDGQLSDAAFLTTCTPTQDVKLGLIITHFNQQQSVSSAVTRIRNELLAAPDFEDRITLTLVDNSNNSGVEPGSGVIVIKNVNYGGSGGFARGLLRLVENGSYTHCLFMDDDASCEIESLRRTYKLMSFSSEKKLAIAGSLLHLDSPSRLYEKGAFFDGICKRIHPNLDMSNEKDLIFSEEEVSPANYGGWWFFCFKLSDLDFFPFPFFIRGDDTTFSLTNKFSLLTMNGIASYGESFDEKNGALTTYFDVRGHLVKQIGILGHSRYRILKNLLRFFTLAVFSYQYGSARAVCRGALDMAQGPEFFSRNMEMGHRIKEVSTLSNDDGIYSDEPNFVVPSRQHKKESSARILFRALTLNGYLIPNIFLKNETIQQNPGFKAAFSDIFLYRKVYYGRVGSHNGKRCELNRKKFLKCSFEMLITMLTLAFRYNSIRRDYEAKMPEMMSYRFWQDIYSRPTSESDTRTA